MKHSIKMKLFLLFSGVMAVFLTAGVIFSTLFLQRYYIAENRTLLSQVASELNAVLSDSRAQLQSTIEEIDRAESISITIADSSETVAYASYPRKETGGTKLPQEIAELIGSNADTAYGEVSSGNGSAARIAYAAKADSGEWIILTKQLKGVTESADIANRFFIIFAVSAILLGGIVIFWFSGKIVKPVVEMNRVAKNIADLRFETIQDIHSHDELGELAESMNVISEKLEESIDSLKKDIIYQKQLTRDTSHELKTPIGVIKGYAEGLIYGVADDEKSIQEYCRTIVNECDRMDELVKDMLELSALEARGAAAQKEKFPAMALVHDLEDSFQPLFAASNVRFIDHCGEELIVNADYSLLKRALGNFMTNAVRYGDENQYIRLSVVQEGSRIRFSVFNSGAGIPESDLPHIWDMFYKVDKARTRESGGHGLGLAIVKSIADLHGGTCGAENQKGGIEFYISI